MNERRRHHKGSILATLGEALGISSRREGDKYQRVARSSSRKHLRDTAPRDLYNVEVYPQRRNGQGGRKSSYVSSPYPSELKIRGAVSSDGDSDTSGASSDTDERHPKKHSLATNHRRRIILGQKESSSSSSTCRAESTSPGNYRLVPSDMAESTFSIFEDVKLNSKHRHNLLPKEEFRKAIAEFEKDYTHKLESSKIVGSKQTDKEMADSTRRPLCASNSVGNQGGKDFLSDDETVVDATDLHVRENTLKGRSRSSMMLDGHFCAGCGIRRATRHQEERAQSASDTAWKNLCQPCLKKYCDGNKYAVDAFGHLCWGCGFARSAHFHKQHPVGEGNPVPNICSFCRLQRSRKSEMLKLEPVKKPSSTKMRSSVAKSSSAEVAKTQGPYTPKRSTASTSHTISLPLGRQRRRRSRGQGLVKEASPSTPSSIYRQPTVESDLDTSESDCEASTVSADVILEPRPAMAAVVGEDQPPPVERCMKAAPAIMKTAQYHSPLINGQGQKTRHPREIFTKPAPEFPQTFHETEHVRQRMYEKTEPLMAQGSGASLHSQANAVKVAQDSTGTSDPFVEYMSQGRAPDDKCSAQCDTPQHGHRPQQYGHNSFAQNEMYIHSSGTSYQEKQRIARERAYYFANMSSQRSTSQHPRSSNAFRGPANPEHSGVRPSTSGCDGRSEPGNQPRESHYLFEDSIPFFSTRSHRQPVFPEPGFVKELLSDDESASPGSTKANVGQTLTALE
ncbi:predicted protein [Verticillium alfalfae VaMs.102]|uniref:Predicted protein n=1 Tax=Verticillium alfalfae (strain VaMs.102 / ATCC MYA-4576 / FGSC 10136) TaxID=526221 RepID=C9SMF0_VERA1|nr:predicted protein [Verticillium alfalfae VaMs.102]EEY19965.1 predicted protein [Verticillium alfalfae VaMs.102]